MPANNDIMNEYIQYMAQLLKANVVATRRMMKDKMLIHNDLPNFRLKILFAMSSCIMLVAN